MKFSKETYYTCNYGDLEQLIIDTYGLKNFSIPASMESNNDSDIDLGNITDKELDSYDIEAFNTWLTSKEEVLMWRVDLIMNDLVRKGLLPAGNWLVSVSW